MWSALLLLNRKEVLIMGRTRVWSVSLVAACFLLGACSNQSSTKKEEDENTITITYRSGGGANAGLTDWLNQEVIPEFEKQNKGANIELSPLNVSEGDYFAKIALMLKSKNTAPDIVTEDTFMVNSDASAGYLEPLDDKIKNWDDWSNFTENVKQGVMAQDGKIYGVPYNTDSRGIWYNKELFKEAGIEVPWQPKSWEDILTAAQAIKTEFGKDVTPLWMNSGKATGEATSMQTFEMLLYGTEDPLYDQESKKWIVKSEGLLNTFQFIDDIYEKGLGANLSQVLNGQGSTVAYQQLLPKGKLAMGIDGIWQTGNWREDGPAPWKEAFDVLGFAPMPTENGQGTGNVTMSGGWAFSIPKNGDDKDLAWKFIQFASSKEKNLSLLLKDRSLTPRDDVAKDPTYQEIPMFKEATEFLQNAQFRPAVDKYPNVSTIIQTLVEDVATNKLTPEQAADQYKANVTKLVGEDLVIER